MAFQSVQAGSGVIVMVNGIPVGFATSINYTRSLGTKIIHEIDNPFAAELAIIGPYSVAGTLSGFRLRDSGGLDGQGIMNSANVSNYFNQRYATLEIVDRLSGKTIGQIQQCLFDRDSWNFNTKAPVTFSVSFIGTFLASDVT